MLATRKFFSKQKIFKTGVDPKIQKGEARTLAGFIDTLYFTENSLKNITENFTEKGVTAVQLTELEICPCKLHRTAKILK